MAGADLHKNLPKAAKEAVSSIFAASMLKLPLILRVFKSISFFFYLPFFYVLKTVVRWSEDCRTLL